MVHRGRHYIQLNRSRMIIADAAWNQLMPTEYKWAAIGGWSGPRAAGCPLGGRGVFPNAWVQGETSITHSVSFSNTHGDFIVLALISSIEPFPQINSAWFSLKVNGAEQFSGVGGSFLDGFPWENWTGDSSNPPNHPGGLLWPSFGPNFQAVTYADSPPAPDSIPF